MVEQSLKNKRIIISAGASGIGLATAKVCLARGAIVYICDLDNKSIKLFPEIEWKNIKITGDNIEINKNYYVESNEIL